MEIRLQSAGRENAEYEIETHDQDRLHKIDVGLNDKKCYCKL